MVACYQVLRKTEPQDRVAAALHGVGRMPAPGADGREAAQVFYVAATRATYKLLVGVRRGGRFRETLAAASVANAPGEITPFNRETHCLLGR